MKKLKWIVIIGAILLCVAGIAGKFMNKGDEQHYTPSEEGGKSTSGDATQSGYLDKDGVVVLPGGPEDAPSSTEDRTDEDTAGSSNITANEDQEGNKVEPAAFDVLVTVASIPFNVTGRKGTLELMLPQTLESPHVRVKQDTLGDFKVTGVYIYTGKENDSADNIFFALQLMNKEQVPTDTSMSLVQEISGTGMCLTILPLMSDAMTEPAYSNYTEIQKYIAPIAENAKITF